MEISSFFDKQQVIDKLAELAAEVNRTAVIVESSPTLSQRVGMSMQGAEEGEAQYAERVSSIDNFNAASKYNALWQRAVDNKYITILDGTPRVEQHTNTHSGLRGGFWLAPPFKTQLEPVGEPVRFFPTTPVPMPLPVNPVTNEPLIPALPPTGTVMDGAGSPQKPRPPKVFTDPPFFSNASFKAGTNKVANAAGRKALADAAKAAAATSKLKSSQTKQLMNNVAKAIKGNTTSGNLTLGKPKGSSTRGGKPLSRPAGSGNNTVPGRTYITNTPIPTVASWPPGAVSSPSPGCFKDKNGATFCT